MKLSGAVIRTPGSGAGSKPLNQTSHGSGGTLTGGGPGSGPPPAPVYKPASPPSTPTSPLSPHPHYIKHGSLAHPPSIGGQATHGPNGEHLEHLSDAVDTIMDEWEAELAKHVRHRRRSGQFDSCNTYTRLTFLINKQCYLYIYICV